MKVAIFPGSFDPFTKGHEDIVQRGLQVFDKIIIAVGINTSKKYYFTMADRLTMIRNVYADQDNVSVETFDILTVKFCMEKSAPFILRGLRNALDFSYEMNIAQMNKKLNSEVETVFIISNPEYAAISSTILRELLRNNEDISQFVPRGMNIGNFIGHAK